MNIKQQRLFTVMMLVVMLCANLNLAFAATRPVSTSSAPQGDFRTVGSYVTFGSYEQDNYAGNGKEPIEWLVLDYDPNGDYALLISRYCLDAHYFNEESYGSWRDSDIRSWLNDQFYYTAFNSSERSAVLMAEVETVTENGRLDTTQDQVFLLSKEEAMMYFPGRTWNESEEVSGRRAVPTAYAVARKAYQSNKTFVNGQGTTCWWLRSYYGSNGKSGSEYREYANGVRESGSVYGYSLKTYNTNKWYGVRPVIWVSVPAAEQVGTSGSSGHSAPAASSSHGHSSSWPVGETCTVVNVQRTCHGRSGPGMAYPTIAYIYPDEQFTVLECRLGDTGKDWYKVYADGEYCWISSGLVEVNGNRMGTVNGVPIQ